MKFLLAVIALSFSLASLAATKAELQVALDATDISNVFSIKTSAAQLAMAGTLSLDISGSDGEDILQQHIILYTGNKPSIKDKFPLKKVELKEEEQVEEAGPCSGDLDAMSEKEFLEKCGN